MALHEIDADLKTAEAVLHHWESKYPKIARDEATAKVEHELAWANAIDKIVTESDGGKLPTVAVMEAEATKRCAGTLRAKREAEAEADIAKKLIGIAETTLTSIQTRVKLEVIKKGLSN